VEALGGVIRAVPEDPPLLTVGRATLVLVLPPFRAVEPTVPPPPLFTVGEGLTVLAPEDGGVVLRAAEEPEVGLRSSTGRLVPALGVLSGVTITLEGRRAASLSTPGAADPEDPLTDLLGTAVGDPAGDPAEGTLALG
jgi:hypothetical protein